MKVSTDSILLGSWIKVDNSFQSILDIGTGSGLLALMLAQKSNAPITAVEIEVDAATQAQINFQNSPWATQIDLLEGDINQLNIDDTFDLIVSNPPYFKSGQQFDTKRQSARHDGDLSFTQLLDFVSRKLSLHGCFYLVLPYSASVSFIELAQNKQLSLQANMSIQANIKKAPYCSLLSFKRQPDVIDSTKLVIYDEKNQYTDEFKLLTRDYYLNF